jgi:hypothetical protein
MKSPDGGQVRMMNAITKSSAFASLCVVPLLGCILGTDQLGEPDDTGGGTGGSTAPSTTSPADDGMTSAPSSETSASMSSTDDATTTPPTSTSDDDAESSTGCSMQECTDVPFGEVCDPWLQNCPRGQKCLPYATEGNAWNALACSPIAEDPNGVGEPCTVVDSGLSGIDDCEAGAMCFFTDVESLAGTCIAQCEGTPDDPVCAEGTTCVIANEGVLTLCLQSCDPELPECPAGQICIPTDDGPVCYPDFADPGGYGEDCSAFECNPGLVCIDAEFHAACAAEACCTPYCDPDGRPCPDGMTCAVEGDADVGICALP